MGGWQLPYVADS